jgi:hypothetical protein
LKLREPRERALVFLDDGKITGKDTVIAYSGTYEQPATILLLWFERIGTAKDNPRYSASTSLN